MGVPTPVRRIKTGAAEITTEVAAGKCLLASPLRSVDPPRSIRRARTFKLQYEPGFRFAMEACTTVALWKQTLLRFFLMKAGECQCRNVAPPAAFCKKRTEKRLAAVAYVFKDRRPRSLFRMQRGT